MYLCENSSKKMLIDKNNIKAVWLDLDDTLWDFTTNSCKSLRDLYEIEHLCRWFSSCEEWIDRYLECNHSLWPLYNKGEITKEFLKVERFRRILVDVGYESDAEEYAKRLDVMYLDILGRKTLLVDGARELLDYLKKQGYKICLISNGFYEVQYNKMRSSQIDGYFDIVVLSDDLGINKPDRRIFDYARDKAGVEPGQCVIIGDNTDTDIYGAINAGWNAIYFNRNGMKEYQAPYKSIEVWTLSEVEKIL